jgi:hypothetical protein
MSHTHKHPLAHRPPQSRNGTPDKLHVLVPISNQVRYQSRYELFHKFREHVEKEPLAELYVVEVGFGRRPFEVTEACNPRHLQLRTYDEIWTKENALNLLAQRLPPDARYIAIVDGDIEFQRKDWVTETMQQLQHHMVVQMWQNAVDLGPYGEVIGNHQGFAWSYLAGKPRPQKNPKNGYSYPHWHPGYAWAFRKEAWDALGGLYDVSVLGSGDHLMAWALLGENMLPNTMSEGYTKSLADWMGRAERLMNRDIGYVPGTILHFYHGTKANRRYQSRWKILEDSQFDPFMDLKRDWQGLYQLDVDGTPRMIRLRDEIRAYFRRREEDSF